MNRPPLWLLTAPSGAGKTTWCRHLAAQARSLGWDAAGLLSPPRFEDGVKTGIRLQDLRTGESRFLGSRALPEASLSEKDVIPVGQWRLDARVLAWGNRVLRAALPCDLLLVDELGPLEFRRGAGLTAAFEALSTGAYRLGVVVVRPALVEAARSRWPWARVLPLEEGDKVTVTS